MYGKNLRYGFETISRGELRLLTIPAFSENGFEKHCFTTRIGGVSPNVYESLNLSKTREENEANKRENYRRVCGAIDVGFDSMALVNYSHGDGIHIAQETDAGSGIFTEPPYDFCDGIITALSEVTAVTLHADCVPLFFADPRNNVAGVAHAGWKGVYMQIPEKMIAAFSQNFGSDPADMLVGIGPHIMDCCFEVRSDVAQPFSERFGGETVTERDGSLFVDMQAAILLQLERAGVSEQNITVANMCTYCNSQLFYSHRRDNGHTGAMGSFITVR